ncbi:MAG: S-layer homology domain-containing protein [Desulfurococcaceae archaeon]
MKKERWLFFFLTSIVSILFVVLSYVTATAQTFLKFYHRQSAITMYGGFSLISPDGKILLNADIMNGILAVLDQNGNIEIQRRITTQMGFPLMNFVALPLSEGEISITGIAPGFNPALVYGVLRSDFSPKFIKAINLNQLPFESEPIGFAIVKKYQGYYYALVEFEEEDYFYLVRLDSNGNIVQIKEFELAEDHTIFGFKELSDGTLGLAGGLYYSDRFFFARGDLSGYVYTARSYRSTSPNLKFDWAEDLAETPDGNILIIGTGRFTQYGSSPNGIILLKVTKSGDLLWAKFYMPNISVYYDLNSYNVLVRSDGVIYVVGDLSYGQSSKLFILKLDTNGNLISVYNYNFNAQSLLSYSAHLVNDYIIISGPIWYENRLGIFLLKVDYDGNLHSCQIRENLDFSVSNITSLVSVNSLPVISRDISPNTIVPTNFNISMTTSDIISRDICAASGPTISPFIDVSPNYWAYAEIVWIKERGITTGYEDGTFRPEAPVLREQMAAFIIRALLGENFNYSMTPYFHDVPTHSWSFRYVQKLYEMGITKGCGGAFFCPYDVVTRAQMAAFLVRALVGEDFSYSDTPYFSDVPREHWAFKYIQKLKELGITKGYGDGTYRPEKAVSRAEMAVFLYRAFNK